MRHGETKANASGRIQGSTDWSSSLTAKGRTQAAEVGAMVFGSSCCSTAAEQPPPQAITINTTTIDHVYISPLTRAKETLSNLRQHSRAGSIPQQETVLKQLTGIQLYSWEGQNVADLKEQDPDTFRAWVEGDALHLSIAGRRPVTEVWQRAVRVWGLLRSLEEEEEEKEETSTLLVCHGTLSQALLCTSFGWDETYFRKHDFPNCGMVEVLWKTGETHAMCWRWRYPTPSEWIHPHDGNDDAMACNLQQQKINQESASRPKAVNN